MPPELKVKCLTCAVIEILEKVVWIYGLMMLCYLFSVKTADI